MTKHDQLTTGWQVFLFNVTLDHQTNLLHFGLAFINSGQKSAEIKMHDPDQPNSTYLVKLPTEYLNNNRTIVHLRKSLPYRPA